MIIHIENQPANIELAKSLQRILSMAFARLNAAQNTLLLIADETYINQLLRNPPTEPLFVNTLSLPTAIALRSYQPRLKKQGITVLSDYANPFSDYNDKKVLFFDSEVCRPLTDHVYAELAALLQPLLDTHNGSMTRVGSDMLPQFPCKLDVDILVCIPDDDQYRMFCAALSQGRLFRAEAQQNGTRHCFFYAELLGTPIDLHVCSGQMDANILYRQTRALQNDTSLQQAYREFKHQHEGLPANQYRTAKALFRKNIGWAEL